MKQFMTLAICVFTSGTFLSCSKISTAPSTVAAVSVVNFTYTNNGQKIGFGSVNEFSVVASETPVSIVQATDTTTPFFEGIFNFKVGGIYSLFVAGSAITPDTMLVQDIIPHWPYADSSAGLRFVNLVQAESISIDYVGGTGNVASNLAYKGIVGFQQFSANSLEQVAGYKFEFRDAESDSLLATLQVTIMPNLCQTLIFAGSGSGRYSAFTENNF
jgi:hypothetical protein